MILRWFDRIQYKPKFVDPAERKPWNFWWLLLALWLASAIPELVLHISTARDHALFNAGLVLSVLFAMVPAMLIFAIVSLIPKKGVALGICIGYSLLYALLAGSQLVYYKIFDTYYTAYSMVNGGQALMDFWKVAFNTVLRNFHWVLILLLPTLFFSIFSWRVWEMKGLQAWRYSAAMFAGTVAVQALLIICLPLFGGKAELTPYDLYYNTGHTYYGINQLGLVNGFGLNVARTFGDDEPQGTINLEITKPTFQWPTKPKPTSPATTKPIATTTPNFPTIPGTTGILGTEPQPTAPYATTGPTIPTTPPTTVPVVTEPPAPPIDTSPNVLSLDFDSLISQASNSQLKQLHQYFQSRTPSSKNAYTGMFEGCNLIMICAEGFSTAVIDPQRTPTLYKMMTEGMYLSNYYVPTWYASTTDGEYVFLTGTLPKSEVWSFQNTIKNAMPLTMSQQLIKQGYNAYAYHGHTYSYYKRNQYLENLGFAYKAYGNGLNVKYTWPESDIEVVDLSTADFVSSTPFVTYYMTISGHLEYSFPDNYIAWKNKADAINEPYSSHVQAYIATQLEFERSLTLLLERLESAGQLENTVIVITADHDPYGLTDAEYSELMGTEISSYFDRYKNGCIIYKAGMEPVVVDALSSHLDLLPTLSNLFGLDFDSRLYMGRDVFSESEALVMFENRSWITDYACYNAETKQYSSLIGEEVPQAYYDYIKSEVSNRFTISKWILEMDYWRILFPNS